MVGPGGDQQAGEHKGQARQGRQDDPSQADQHQRCGQDVVNDGSVHEGYAGPNSGLTKRRKRCLKIHFVRVKLQPLLFAKVTVNRGLMR